MIGKMLNVKLGHYFPVPFRQDHLSAFIDKVATVLRVALVALTITNIRRL
jgi:hypothetical protein